MMMDKVREPVFLLAASCWFDSPSERGSHSDGEGSLVTTTQRPRTFTSIYTSPAFVTVKPSATAGEDADPLFKVASAKFATPSPPRPGAAPQKLPPAETSASETLTAPLSLQVSIPSPRSLSAPKAPANVKKAEPTSPARSLGHPTAEATREVVAKVLPCAKRSSAGTGVTLMVCNIPCRCEQADLVQAIDENGFKGMYASVNIPTRRRYKGGQSNLGYAFVHFPDPNLAVRFWLAFQGFRFKGSQSQKVCSVQLADVQQGNSSSMRGGRSLPERS